MTARPRAAALCACDPDRTQLWAGHGAPMAKTAPFTAVPQDMWMAAQALLPC